VIAGRRRIVRLEDLIGRRVRTPDGRVIGRIGEVRAERRANGDHEVTDYLVGPGAWLERLGIVRESFQGRAHMIVVRWDQMDIRRPEAPTLTCPAEDLERNE
jgi:sporulation protein YlmC with PRC-barrel domain